MIKKFFGVMILLATFFFTQSVFASPYLTYQAHVQNKGWQRAVGAGQVAGTTGKNLRLEAIIINCDGIEYNANVQHLGWQGWRRSGDVAGTVGEDRRMNAIRIRLTGRMAERYDVYYRAHVQNIGWQDWVKNGRIAGTEGEHLRIEALQIELVAKDSGYNRYNNDRYDDDSYSRHRRHRYDDDNGDYYYDSRGRKRY